MLQLSRLHAGRFVLCERPFMAQDVLRGVVDMFAAEASALSIQLDCDMAEPASSAPDADAALRTRPLIGDGQRIMQVLVNLVSNALKFTRYSKVRRVRVTLELRRAATTAEAVDVSLVVEDTGVGMTPDEQARLFVPFGQANAKTYSNYGGSGMGLFISKALLDVMHGTIAVRSMPGEGTAFTMKVPCRLAPAEAPPPEPVSLPARSVTKQPSAVAKLPPFARVPNYAPASGGGTTTEDQRPVNKIRVLGMFDGVRSGSQKQL